MTLLADSLSTAIVIMPIIGIMVLIFLFFAIWSSRYTKVGPNQVLVISGRQYLHRKPDGTVEQRGFRIVKGGGSFVLPVIEKVDVLNLEPVTIEFQFNAIVTDAGEQVSVSGIAQAKINSDDLSIAKAAEHFLNKGAAEIRATVMQVLESHCRKIAGSSPLVVGAKVEEQSARDLGTMGLSLGSFTIRSFSKTDSATAGTGKPPISAIT